MKDTFLSAKLINETLLRVNIHTGIPFQAVEGHLEIDGIPGKKLLPRRVSTLQSSTIADFQFESPLELGHSYVLAMPGYGRVPVDVSELTELPDFDEKYGYDGDDLGATYVKGGVAFALWAPLASSVLLYHRTNKSDPFEITPCTRTDKGVYRALLKGKKGPIEYFYEVTNSEIAVKVTDPYAKASSANGRTSFAIDWSKQKRELSRECLPRYQNPTDCIIYETSVRDLTVSSYTDIEHKGKFLGLAEKGRKTKGGKPAGLDYLKSLGITHVQLLPIYDFKSVDEEHPFDSYNWGYDPAQYFVPEGSFATDPNDPYSRILELKEMVKTFHEAGIAVVMDVVYNHVYEYQSSVFEKVVPNYYFRKRHSGAMATTSGCGDDFASERKMVGKLIREACAFWQDEYGIDGFRFDLMGIIDVDTLNAIAERALAKNPFFLLYGEGWNMGGDVSKMLGHMGNYKEMPKFAFFNDFYREGAKRYCAGDYDAMSQFKNALISSSVDYIFQPHFSSGLQSINYVECHDNETYYDYLSKRFPKMDLEEKLSRCSLALHSVLFSLGIPLIHMGQEIAQSKFGLDNTYNAGDEPNKFSYRLMEERYEMVERFIKAVEIRKKEKFFHFYDPASIIHVLDVVDFQGALRLFSIDSNVIAPRKQISCYFNPTSNYLTYGESLPCKLLLASSSQCGCEKGEVRIAPFSLVITVNE